jgi:pSer/pThr/pTyr-binding forkhead associated (FHA) protein
MAPLGFVEVLDSRGSVVERLAVDSFPITVGRAYSNQVILNDPYVCPTHARIERDEQGRLIARDLNSVNGLRADAQGEGVASLEIRSGMPFRVGRTVLRFCSIAHPLPATLRESENGPSRWASPYTAGIAGLAIFLLLSLDSYLGMVERGTVAKVIAEPVFTLTMLLVWAGLWSLASRVVVSRFHFNFHVTIVCAAIAAFFALGFGSEWLEFLFPAVPTVWIAGLFGSGLIVAALAYAHLGFASAMRPRARLWAALSLSAAMAAVGVISDFANRSKFSNVMEFSAILKPIDTAWLPTISIDQFIERSQELRRELDTLAHKGKAVQP